MHALVLRQHFGDDLVDPELFRHRLGRHATVAGQHDDPHAFGVQLPDGFGAGRLDGIGDAEPSRELAVHRDKQRAGASDVHASFLHEGQIPNRDFGTVDTPAGSFAGNRLKRLN